MSETTRERTPFDYPFLRQHFGWRIALCQHPMYILVDEDRGEPIIGERVPPCGAATGEEYLERVQRNMASMERFSQLKGNYEWAAIALDEIAQKAPHVYAQMKARFEAGSIEFIGGELSLAHLHTYGSESCWRQFEYGLEVYQRLFGARVRVHAHQETQLFEQLPQVLRHFGIEYMVMPCFPWAVKLQEGSFELLGQESGTYLKQGDEFLEAEALDGTTLPVYVATHVRSTDAAAELSKDLFGSPPIWIDFPDLDEINEKDLHKWSGLYDIVLLGDALTERVACAPPRVKGRLHTYWSYVEGVWAEEHLRANRIAEEAALFAGGMLAMAGLAGTPVDRQTELGELWRQILKYQDHEVTWIEVTDLRRKGISAFEAATAKAREIMQEAAGRLTAHDDSSFAVFNALPRPRQALLDLPADEALAGGPCQRFGERCLAVRALPAGGFASFPRGEATPSTEAPRPSQFATDHYRVEFDDTGLMRQLRTASGTELLNTGAYLGGEVRTVIDDRWADNRLASCRWYEGEVCSILERTGTLAHIPLIERYFFFPQLHAIRVELHFDFHGDEVGYFHLEESKINVYYPSTGSEVFHDVPFGYLEARQNEHLVATNWLFCGGLVYANRGTIRHWVRDGVIANTLAWGGTKFTNRIHYKWWMDRSGPYDLRLYGKHRIEYWLLPLGAFDGPRVVREVEALTAPLFLAAGSGERSLYEIEDDRLEVTSLYEKDGRVWVRGYQMPGAGPGRFRDWEIFNQPLQTLA